jgi:hypothetical protein
MKGFLGYLAFLAVPFVVFYIIAMYSISPEEARRVAAEKEREAAIDMAVKPCDERQAKFVREMKRQGISIRVEHNKWHVACPEWALAQ